MQSPSFASRVRCSAINQFQPIAEEVVPRQRDCKVVGILSTIKSPLGILGVKDENSLEKYGWRF